MRQKRQNIDYYISCSPTTDKLDFRYKTEAEYDKCSKAQMRELTMANLDVIIASMKLQGMKYRHFHGLDIIDEFYQRLINRAQQYMPVMYAVMDAYEPPPNITMFKHNVEYYIGSSFEEYRYMGAKLDVKRKNMLKVTDSEQVLRDKLTKLQKTILRTVLWASNYIKTKRQDTLWGSLHIQIHDLVQHIFTELNADLDKMPNGVKKAKALH
ncbi:unnamed protein product, partial [Medioppia subpectinata]